MSLSAHIAELQKKHAILAQKVEVEERSPGSDDGTIRAMKRQKLQIKDEIARLSDQL